MLLTAQRVISAATRTHGVNVYQYLHGDSWIGRVPDEFLPDANPGALLHEWSQLPAGGNHVVSILDVVASDEIEPPRLQQYLASLKYWLQPTSNVVAAYHDPCWVRFQTATKVPPQIELGALAGAILLRLTGH